MDHLNEWPEVLFINGYAVFIGYLMMGVRGLSVLVITWTTVVLLGGFVSVLGKKDFWCLTVITLVQTVRVFSFLLKERLVDLARSWWGLMGATMVAKPMRNGIEDEDERYNSRARVLLTCALLTIQALVFVIILCPMAVLFVFGMYISAGLGLWRLVEHDFSSDAAEAAGVNHLKPALQVLYSLAVAQGVLFGYKTMHAWGAKVGLAEFVAGRYLLHGDKELVADYLEHTVAGCEKDPSFANGRNLVTYGVDLITDAAKSDDSFAAGVRLLGAANRHGQEALAQKLLTRSASSLIRMTQRLLETLDPRRRYCEKMRQSAGRIAALVAGTVFLEQCPGMIQCISSLLDRFEECITVPPKDYEQEWRSSLGGIPRCDFLLPVQKGLTVLRNLAYREDNCRAIIHTEGLLLKATAPLTSHHLFNENSHFTWYNMADESLKLMCLLAEVPGETGAKLRSEMSRSEEAIIRTLETTLECPECKLLLKRRVVEMLLDLSVDTAPIMARGGRTSRIFIWMLLIIFVSTKDCFVDIGFSIRRMKRRIHIRRVAGEILSSSNQELSAMLSLQQSDDDQGRRAWTMLQSVRFLLGDLTTALLDVGNISIRVPAAKFLGDLCYDFGSHDEYSKELQKAVVRVMPQVLRELLGYMLTREEAQVVTQENNIPASSEDIESGGVSQAFAKETPSSHQQMGEQPEDIPVPEALLTSLCMTVQSRWYSFDLDFARQLDEVARKVGSEQGKDVNNKFSDLPFLPIWRRRNLVIS